MCVCVCLLYHDYKFMVNNYQFIVKLFICGLFYDSVGNSGYMELNHRLINE
jgi:hypothetical protein